MSFVTRLWKDRQVEKPNRWKFVNDEETETKYYTASRAEGTIDIIGDAINAENMNDLETRINSAFNAEAQARDTAVSTLTTNVNSQITTLTNNVDTSLTEMQEDVDETVEALTERVNGLITFDETTHKMVIHL